MKARKQTIVGAYVVSTVQLEDGTWETLVFPRMQRMRFREVEGITNVSRSEAMRWHTHWVQEYTDKPAPEAD